MWPSTGVDGFKGVPYAGRLARPGTLLAAAAGRSDGRGSAIVRKVVGKIQATGVLFMNPLIGRSLDDRRWDRAPRSLNRPRARIVSVSMC